MYIFDVFYKFWHLEPTYKMLEINTSIKGLKGRYFELVKHNLLLFDKKTSYTGEPLFIVLPVKIKTCE